jgi:hypothetical protein
MSESTGYHNNHGSNNHMNTYLNGLTYTSYYWKAKYYELLQQYHKLLYKCKIHTVNDNDSDDNTNTNNNDYDWYGSKNVEPEKHKIPNSPPLLPPHPMPPVPKGFAHFPYHEFMNRDFAMPPYPVLPPHPMHRDFPIMPSTMLPPTHEIPPSSQPPVKPTFQVPLPPQPIARDCSGMIKATHNFPFHRYIGFEPPYTHFGEDSIQK